MHTELTMFCSHSAYPRPRERFAVWYIFNHVCSHAAANGKHSARLTRCLRSKYFSSGVLVTRVDEMTAWFAHSLCLNFFHPRGTRKNWKIKSCLFCCSCPQPTECVRGGCCWRQRSVKAPLQVHRRTKLADQGRGQGYYGAAPAKTHDIHRRGLQRPAAGGAPLHGPEDAQHPLRTQSEFWNLFSLKW